jgi:hypothetical protein
MERKMSWRCSKNDDFTELAAELSTKERMNKMYKVRISDVIFSSSANPTGIHKPGTIRGSVEPVDFALRLIDSNLWSL